MSTPFDRLRKAIDSVKIQYRAASYLQSNGAPQRDMGSCSCGCSEVENIPPQTIYFTQEQMNKVVSLYEAEKCRLINLRERHLKEVAALKQQIERGENANKRLMDENERVLLRVNELVAVEQKYASFVKISNEKERISKEEIQRVNVILQELSKELNHERGKRKNSQQQVVELTSQLQKLSQTSKRNESQTNKEFSEIRTQNDELKKMIDYQILTKSKQLTQLHQQYANQLASKDAIIQDRQKFIQQLSMALQTSKQNTLKLSQAAKNYQLTIVNLTRDNQLHVQTEHQLQSEFSARLAQLSTEIQRLTNIQHRVFELQHELQEEKCKQKYHIVEVKDNSKEIELEVVKRQLKQMIEEKAMFQVRLKKMCKCKASATGDYKHTMVEYQNKPKLQEYWKTHEVILKRTTE